MRKKATFEKIYRMKSVIRLIVILVAMAPALSFGQTTKKAAWPEMKTFHSFMSSTFHPSEEGNLQPLKMKADSLLIAAKAWQASAIPSSFKAAETKTQLEKLVKYCTGIADAVHAGASDDSLKGLIAEAHEVFHKIAGECRKADE